MNDYTIFYKTELPIDQAWTDVSWDIFISCYNPTDRVNRVFNSVNAACKYWIMQKDYGFNDEEHPENGVIIIPHETEEISFIKEVVAKIGTESIKASSICIDITGFIKPNMMVLCRWLYHLGCRKFDVIYSEPGQYADKEKTKFSDEIITDVRQVAGFSGQHSSNSSNDLLVIGAGYDDELISYVAEYKSNTKKIQMIGFPSLRPDMYQENVLNVHKASESVEGNIRNAKRVIFAPANDPFVTATVLSDLYERENSIEPVSNLYLSPLSTKPQALGFTLFYLLECLEKPVSIIYPFCNNHAKETTRDVSRIWKYTIEL